MHYKLSEAEQDAVYSLAMRLTGTHQVGDYRRDILIYNIERRIHEVGASSLNGYLGHAAEHGDEYAQMLSALTIHTTEWFRELPHYGKLAEIAKAGWPPTRKNGYRVLSLGCSTGEEVYSLALTFEALKKVVPHFSYQIHGWDIDPVSIAKARTAIYKDTGIAQIPAEYRGEVLLGSGPTKGHFTLSPDVRRRCQFTPRNLMAVAGSGFTWDLIVCRNVLIYFSPARVKELMAAFNSVIVPGGVLCLGHSEASDVRSFGFEARGNSIYVLKDKEPAPALAIVPTLGVAKPEPMKLLIVDDSKMEREILRRVFEAAGFAVSDAASTHDGERLMREVGPFDLISLDIHMPVTDGPTWLAQLRARKDATPCLIIAEDSAETASKALTTLMRDAQDLLSKAQMRSDPQSVGRRALEIARAGRAQRSAVKPVSGRKMRASLALRRPELIVIGASTGGTEALTKLLSSMPPNAPPVMVVQHITPAFTLAFAQRLAGIAGMTLAPPQDGLSLGPGMLFMSQSDNHIVVREANGRPIFAKSNAAPLGGHRPSVDVLFRSAAATQLDVLAILLTGMGQDGAKGMLELHKKGAVTLAQDEASSVVYGMPKEAVRLGAVDFSGTIPDLRSVIFESLAKPPKRKAS